MSVVEEWLVLLGGISGDDLKAAQAWDALAGGRPALIVGADGAVDPLASVGCMEWTRMAGATAQLFPTSAGGMVAPTLAASKVKKSEPVKEVSPLTGAPLLGLFDPSTGMNWATVPEAARLMLRWARQARPGLMSGMSDREIFSAIQDPADPMTVRIRLAWDALPESERVRAREGSFVQGGRQTAVAAPPARSEPTTPIPSEDQVHAAFARSRGPTTVAIGRGIAKDFGSVADLRLVFGDVAHSMIPAVHWDQELELAAFDASDTMWRRGGARVVRQFIREWAERYPGGAGLAAALRVLS